jgi:hypothetical protein
MEPAIQQLIDAIKQASPYVWHVAYRQVFVDAGVGAVWSIGMLLAGLYCFKLARRIVVPKEILSSDGPAMAKVFSVIGAAVFGFVGFYFLLDNIEEVLNPGYSAIRMIIELAKH